jgi:AcrR family transcriptional regulator
MVDQLLLSGITPSVAFRGPEASGGGGRSEAFVAGEAFNKCRACRKENWASMNGNNRRIEILRAARRIAKRNGVMALSIEAVAKEAKLSKGGVLYHFPGKELMIKALIEDWRMSFQTLLKEYRARDPRPGGWCRSYIRATLQSYKPSRLRMGRLGAALYVASAFNPKLLSPVRDELKEIQENIEKDGVDPNIGTIVRLVMDGFWLNEIFGLHILPASKKKEIIGLLEKMVSESVVPRQ